MPNGTKRKNRKEEIRKKEAMTFLFTHDMALRDTHKFKRQRK